MTMTTNNFTKPNGAVLTHVVDVFESALGEEPKVSKIVKKISSMTEEERAAFFAEKQRKADLAANAKKEETDNAGDVAPAPTEPVQLKIWPHDVRAVPTIMSRTAIFSIDSSRSEDLKKEWTLVASNSDAEAYYLGKRLSMFHALVWEELIHLGRKIELGEYMDVPEHLILEGIGRTKGKSDYVEVRQAIDDLMTSSVKIRFPNRKRFIVAHMLDAYTFDEMRKVYRMRLGREMVQLFTGSGTSYIDNEQRQAIGAKSQLTARLLRFFSGHSNPITPYSVKEWHRQVESKDKVMSGFRRNFLKALQNLVEKGVLKSAYIDPKTDLVHVTKSC
jgi:TrfA protein